MREKIDIWHNRSGVLDVVAGQAINKAEKDSERFNKLLGCIFYICESAGFHIENRLVIKDLKTGKVYK